MADVRNLGPTRLLLDEVDLSWQVVLAEFEETVVEEFLFLDVRVQMVVLSRVSAASVVA